MKIEDIEILASILNRWPMVPAERMWAQGFIERLQAVALGFTERSQAVVTPPQQSAQIGVSDQ